MEARHILLRLSATLAILVFPQTQTVEAQSRGIANAGQPRPVVTQNFVVYARDPKLAERVGQQAERYRKELAIEWTGQEIGSWKEKCPIQVELGMHAGGETSFAFVTDGRSKGVPVSWQMKIFGPPDRILDAVLPHEITHTIFATHFGQPLPRWADEGACTTVEHESEREKNHRMLIDFLNARPSRGIAFNRMFTMRDYPHDILPLYAQGYSLAKFLIMKNGKRYFLDYINAGMAAETQGAELRAWNNATNQYYGYQDLSDLQVAWIRWVKSGSQEQPNQRLASNSGNAGNPLMNPVTNSESPTAVSPKTLTAGQNVADVGQPQSGSWYASQTATAQKTRVAANRTSLGVLEPASGFDQALNSGWKTETPSDLPGDLGRESAKLERISVSPPTIWR